MEKSDFSNLRVHATGLQTVMKLVENDLNNLPMGYSYGRDANNSPLLKLLFPNMLRIGRLNQRALDGPVRMPAGPGELMQRIETGYSTFFRLFNSTMVPKLLKSPKWFKSGEQLEVNDIIYFQKDESDLSSKWSIGKVVKVDKGRDGLVRRVSIQYQNANEDFSRTTDRAARSIVKLMNIDDTNWLDDLEEAEKLIAVLQDEEAKDKTYIMSKTSEGGLRFRLTATSGHNLPKRNVGVHRKPTCTVARSKFMKPCRRCCCISHCLFFKHTNNDVMVDVADTRPQKVKYSEMLDRSWLDTETYEEEMFDIDRHDPFMSLLCATNLNLNDGASTTSLASA